jgi:outer membrane immunogenic protein
MIRKFSLATAVLVAASASAFAADLPSRRPPPVFTPVPLFTWTGFYVGGDVGYAWGYNTTDSSVADGITGSAPYSSKPNGEIGGVHVGYNYQINQFVIGIEGDVVGSNFNNTGNGYFTNVDGGPVAGVYTSTRIPIEGSIRGRLGYAWDRALFYVTGGAAFGDIEHQYNDPYDEIGDPNNYRKTKVGYTVGGGVEYALSNNWSVRGEYRYTDYGHMTDYALSNDFVSGTTPFDNHVQEHRVTVGFSYKFDMYTPPAPVVAKY